MSTMHWPDHWLTLEEWDALPEETPARIRELLRRSLEKDPSRRLRDVGVPGPLVLLDVVALHQQTLGLADHGPAAEDRGVGVDDHLVFDRRVALAGLPADADARVPGGLPSDVCQALRP